MTTWIEVLRALTTGPDLPVRGTIRAVHADGHTEQFVSVGRKLRVMVGDAHRVWRHGARLRVESSVHVPDTFVLIVEVDGLEADCQVMWRRANEAGVKFLSAPRIVAAKRVQVVNPLAPPKPPSLRRTGAPIAQ